MDKQHCQDGHVASLNATVPSPDIQPGSYRSVKASIEGLIGLLQSRHQEHTPDALYIQRPVDGRSAAFVDVPLGDTTSRLFLSPEQVTQWLELDKLREASRTDP